MTKHFNKHGVFASQEHLAKMVAKAAGASSVAAAEAKYLDFDMATRQVGVYSPPSVPVPVVACAAQPRLRPCLHQGLPVRPALPQCVGRLCMTAAACRNHKGARQALQPTWLLCDLPHSRPPPLPTAAQAGAHPAE